jgi:hypothetical protein
MMFNLLKKKAGKIGKITTTPIKCNDLGHN